MNLTILTKKGIKAKKLLLVLDWVIEWHLFPNEQN